MVNVRPLEELGTAFSNGGQGRAHGVLLTTAADGFETITDSLGHGGGHGFAGFAGQLLSELVGFGVFDVESHFLPLQNIFYPSSLSAQSIKFKS
jgi:hypothetical protein